MAVRLIFGLYGPLVQAEPKALACSSLELVQFASLSVSRSGVASNMPMFPGSYTGAENVLLASKVVPEFSSGMAEGGGGNLISQCHELEGASGDVAPLCSLGVGAVSLGTTSLQGLHWHHCHHWALCWPSSCMASSPKEISNLI